MMALRLTAEVNIRVEKIAFIESPGLELERFTVFFGKEVFSPLCRIIRECMFLSYFYATGEMLDLTKGW
jgi:hypothetical protein